ncbi:MAG: HAD-IA family hydrolase [Lachnospiraceae bacterium]
MQKNKIKAILFDSGKVLNFPASGHWFITPNFFEYVEKEKFDGLDEKMYTTALNELGILPEEVVFVDDNLENCLGAGKLGIHSVLLCRNNWVYRWNKLKSIGKGYCVISTLKQLNDIL